MVTISLAFSGAFSSPAWASSHQLRCPVIKADVAIYPAEGSNRMEKDLSTKQESLYSGSWWGETELEMILFQLDFN